MTHSPAPWKITWGQPIIIDGVANVPHHPKGQHTANALLIASAPELLDALNKINSIIFAVGAPLGSDAYFQIREICCDSIKLAAGSIDAPKANATTN